MNTQKRTVHTRLAGVRDIEVVRRTVESVMQTPAPGEKFKTCGFLRPGDIPDLEQRLTETDSWKVFVAGLDDPKVINPLGVVFCSVVDFKQREMIQMSFLAVRPTFHGLGIGPGLYAAVRALRREYGMDALPMLAFIEREPCQNLQSERFHTKQGFEWVENMTFPDSEETVTSVWIEKLVAQKKWPRP